MPKNYYIVLDIPSTASQEEIKSAYRRLAKEFHPDRYEEGPLPFQVIQEAYSVLGDPIRRQAYDDRRKQQRFSVPRRGTVEPMRGRPEPEPLVPEREAVERGDVSLTRSFQTYGPAFDALFDRILRNFTESRQAPGKRPEPLTPDHK